MGSHGVGKGPTKVTSICRRHRGALLFVLYNTWRHLPSQAQGKINIPIKLLHFSREIVHFALPGFVGTSLQRVVAAHFWNLCCCCSFEIFGPKIHFTLSQSGCLVCVCMCACACACPCVCGRACGTARRRCAEWRTVRRSAQRGGTARTTRWCTRRS